MNVRSVPISRPAILLRLAAVVAAALSVGCGQGPSMAMPERPPPSVSVFPALAKDVPVYLDQIGRALASESVSIQPRVSGPIVGVDFTDGADLAVDAPLFRIDDRPYQARLAEVKAKVTAAEADARQTAAAKSSAQERVATAVSRGDEARAQLVAAKASEEEVHADVAAAEADAARAAADEKRFETATSAVSAMEMDRMRAESRAAAARLAAARRRHAAVAAQEAQAEAAGKTADALVAEAHSALAEAEARVASANAAADSARAAVETARLDVEFCTIKSPIAGRAGRRAFDLGNVVEAGRSVLLTIAKIDPIHVEFTAPEHDLSAVQLHMAREAARKEGLRVEVRLPDETGEPRAGRLVFLDNAVDAGTGTIRMRARLDNADGRFWPGRFVNVRLVLDTLAGAVLIPAGAPSVIGGATLVFVVSEDGTAQARPVTLGQRHGDLVVVASGVAAGERVIAVGQATVMPGGKVHVVEAAPPPAMDGGMGS